ncbi:sce7726 family protein [Bacillus safensis]|uniref:sce7726 family protein n=1 Tax=Bacillus safensis TaxID=561879 RepID=UPI0031F4D065
MIKKNYFEYAQLLSSEYSTLLSNESVRNILLKTFEDQIPIFDKDLSYREFTNQFLVHYYPNEISVKSTFINNILSKTSNHVSIFELNVGNSRLDLCKINRFSTAFEIKTELDTPKRLNKQMEDYFKVFERVYVICSIHNLENIKPYIPDDCGIYTYYITKTGRYVFKKARTAVKSNFISAFAQLSVLTKKDLNTYFECPHLQSKEAMIELIINKKSHNEINKIFKFCLRNKYYRKWNFLLENRADILEIDYQWFFKNTVSPEVVYL